MKVISENEKETLLHCRLIRMSIKALLVEGANGDEVWLPRSQIEEVQKIDDETIELLIPQWLIDKHPLY